MILTLIKHHTTTKPPREFQITDLLNILPYPDEGILRRSTSKKKRPPKRSP